MSRRDPDRPRDLKGLRAMVLRHGCTIVRKGAHEKVYDQKGRILLTIPSTPSDPRSVLNCVSDFRKALRRFEEAS